MSPVRIGMVCVSLMLFAGTARAQDIVAGSQVARTQCTGCHQVGRRPQETAGIAPSFVNIADTKGMTELSIQAFLSTMHEKMPNYVLSQKQIADVASYIMSLHEPNKENPDHGSDRIR